jgi:hypothetical protein
MQVREWLAKQGYPLEYEAARVLRGAGFRTLQGWSYRDVDEAGLVQAREIDVYATLRGRVGGTYDEDEADAAVFTVTVEAKQSTAPWVVLTNEHPPEWTPIVSPWMEQILREAKVEPGAVFPLPERVGFWVKTADRSNDPAYEALMQATNAAAASVYRSSFQSPPEWALPVVVMRDALFTLGYTKRGAEVLEPVPWCRLVWHGAASFSKPTVVDVVTRSHWRTYVRELKAAVATLLKGVDKHRMDERIKEGRERAKRSAEVEARMKAKRE